ncbi:flagellar biosynthesis protein [Celeribacter sp.]|uniref:FliH/SctL family protein n=1 Tax=Celeribacter sp. TaxID=1890673 RepID=UPI003A907A0B
MMSSLFPFEDFGAARKPKEKSTTAAQKPDDGTAQRAIEKARTNGYETGYKAGWDDALAAEASVRTKIGAELERNLQDLGFTFHEARSHIIKSLEPLLFEMTEKVLPELVTHTLGQSIIDEILPFADSLSDTPVEILICPSNKEAVTALLSEGLPMAVTLIDEPSLTEGQVFLRLGAKERKIDLDGAIGKIRDAIDAAFTLNKDAIVNG